MLITEDQFVTQNIGKRSYGLTTEQAQGLVDKGEEFCDFFESVTLHLGYRLVYEEAD